MRLRFLASVFLAVVTSVAGLEVLWAELPALPVEETRGVIQKPGRLPESVATWNLQWFPGNRPDPTPSQRIHHEKEAEQVIRYLDVDLLLVQEVVDREALDRVTREYPWRVVSNFLRAGDEDKELPVQNVAILSKVPIRESWEVGFHRLPLTPDRPVRGFLGARLGTKKNGMTIYTLHLKSNRGGRESSAKRGERAIQYLKNDWESRALDPQKDAMLVAGDFNCSLRNPEFAKEKTIQNLLKEGWVPVTGGISWPQSATVRPDPERKYPASDFDHILLSPGWAKVVKGGKWQAGVMQEPDVPSDHWPVWMRFGN